MKIKNQTFLPANKNKRELIKYRMSETENRAQSLCIRVDAEILYSYKRLTLSGRK